MITPIPLNNQTMGWSIEKYAESIYRKQQEEKEKKEWEEHSKRVQKAQEPYYRKIRELRKAEIEKLCNDENFIKYCKKAKKKGHKIDSNYYERYDFSSGGCGPNYEEIDLVKKFGSKEFNEETERLHHDAIYIKVD